MKLGRGVGLPGLHYIPSSRRAAATTCTLITFYMWFGLVIGGKEDLSYPLGLLDGHVNYLKDKMKLF